MKYLVVSCSLNPSSRSRVLARTATELLKQSQRDVDLLDIADVPLPMCDGAACYGDPNAQEVKQRLVAADGIQLATPIYNYDASAATKNLIELAGRDAWTGKVAGFMCAAGGQGSYMSVMALASSLMLDFRTVIVPRFVYAKKDDFTDDQVSSETIRDRLAELTTSLVRFTEALVDPR